MTDPIILPYQNFTPQIADSAFVAPGAVVTGRATLADQASVWYAAVIRADINTIEIGAGTNIQDGTVVHVTEIHPVKVGCRVVVGHQATLHGCIVGDDALIGIGARVLNGAEIGAGSIVAAGAVVPEGMIVPPGSMVMGMPGRIKRDISPAEKAEIKLLAQSYMDVAIETRQSLQRRQGDGQ